MLLKGTFQILIDTELTWKTHTFVDDSMTSVLVSETAAIKALENMV